MQRCLRTLLLARLAILIAVSLRSDASGESQITDDDLVLYDSKNAFVSLCCHVGNFVLKGECVEDANETEAQLPMIYEINLAPTNLTASEKHFVFLVWDPCKGRNRFTLTPHIYGEEEWYLLWNGSIYRPLAEDGEDRVLNFRDYCLARVKSDEYPDYLVFFCEEEVNEKEKDDEENRIYSFGLLASVPFLAATYVVYSLLPELKNFHGLTLRGYVGCLTIAYCMLGAVRLIPQEQIPSGCCIVIGILHP